jgi:hypothetical protein
MPDWFGPTVGARSALRLSLSYCACDRQKGTWRAVNAQIDRKPSASDIPYPFPLMSPEDPDFFAFPDPNRVQSLYDEKQRGHRAIVAVET